MEKAIELLKSKIKSLEQDLEIPYQGEQAYSEINCAINQLEDLLFQFIQNNN